MNAPIFRDYAVVKPAEGGMGSQTAISLLRNAGIRCERISCPFIGQSGIRVYGDKRIQARATKVLYG